MEQIKKITLLGIIVSMLAVCFCSCAGGDGDAVSSKAASTGENEASVKSALKFEVDEKLDLGKREMSVALWSSVPEEGQSEMYDRRYTLAKRTEEKYNVKFKWIASTPDTFSQDFLLAYLSKKKYADLMFCPSYDGYDVCKIGSAVTALDDYIDYSNKAFSKTGELLKYVDGYHYSYMPDNLNLNSIGFFVIYNTSLLEDAGCNDPFEMYKAGNWTWDSFYEIITKTTKRSGGEVVQYGIGGSNLLDALLLSNGTAPVISDYKSKKFTSGLNTNAGMNTLTFLKKILTESGGCDGWYGQHNSKITFGESKLAMIVAPQYYAATFVGGGMPINTVPLPKGPDANGYTIALEMQEWWMMPSISDFTPQEVLQVAFDMNENDPQFADTYHSPQDEKMNFVNTLYDSNVFVTEDEAGFFYDFINDGKNEKRLNIKNDNVTACLVNDVWKALARGEEPRTVMDRVGPVINTALQNMLPDRLK